MKKKNGSSIDIKQSLSEHTNAFFQMKKNMIINEICFYNRDVLETPDIVMLLIAETLYNTHTGRLLVAGGGAEGFKAYIQELYPQVFFKLRRRIEVLVESLIALKDRDLIEYLPTNESAQAYLDKWADDVESIEGEAANEQNNNSETH